MTTTYAFIIDKDGGAEYLGTYPLSCLDKIQALLYKSGGLSTSIQHKQVMRYHPVYKPGQLPTFFPLSLKSVLFKTENKTSQVFLYAIN